MSDDSMPLDSQIPPATCVLVSGGSRGLGLAITEHLISSGVKVACFSRNPTPDIQSLEAKNPELLIVGSIDLKDSQRMKEFLAEAEERLGPLDGLINNAAIGQDSLLVQTSEDRISTIIDTDLTAPLLLTRLFLRKVFIRSGRARILTISSLCSQRGYAGLTAYSAAKGGLEAATRTLAREVHGRALVNAIAPGFFASEMSSVLGSEQLATIARRTPTGHLVEPADILPVVRMLMLEQTNVNGQVVTVDGGASI